MDVSDIFFCSAEGKGESGAIGKGVSVFILGGGLPERVGGEGAGRLSEWNFLGGGNCFLCGVSS